MSEVDAYIAKSADFAKPILKHLRALIRKACPGVEETLKWGCPHFTRDGKIVCSMAAFKAHCSMGFWNAASMSDPSGLLKVGENTSMGHFGRIETLSDLPSDKILTAYIREAAALTESGAKKILRAGRAGPDGEARRGPLKTFELPSALAAALKKNAAARKAFAAFGPGAQREYADWIAEAKTDATRDRRLETALEWIAEGKRRNWKYEK